MRRTTKSLFISAIISFAISLSAFAAESDWDMSKSQVLKVLDQDKFQRMTEQKMSDQILHLSRNHNRDENSKKLWAYLIKQKRKINPSYNPSMEYIYRLQTKSWRYDVTFDLMTNKCVLKAQSKNEVQRIDRCTKQFYSCLGKDVYTKSAESHIKARGCYSKISACHFEAKPDFKNLDNKRCNRLYGTVL